MHSKRDVYLNGKQERSKSLMIPILCWWDSTRSCQVAGFCKKLKVLYNIKYMLTYKAQASTVKLKKLSFSILRQKIVMKYIANRKEILWEDIHLNLYNLQYKIHRNTKEKCDKKLFKTIYKSISFFLVGMNLWGVRLR
jgi:hypothetical protein